MLVTAEQGKKKGSKTVSTAEQLTVKTDRVITGWFHTGYSNLYLALIYRRSLPVAYPFFWQWVMYVACSDVA